MGNGRVMLRVEQTGIGQAQQLSQNGASAILDPTQPYRADKSNPVNYAADCSVIVTPPYKAYMEEKLLFALYHHPLLRAYWKAELGPETTAVLDGVITRDGHRFAVGAPGDEVLVGFEQGDVGRARDHQVVAQLLELAHGGLDRRRLAHREPLLVQGFVHAPRDNIVTLEHENIFATAA